MGPGHSVMNVVQPEELDLHVGNGRIGSAFDIDPAFPDHRDDRFVDFVFPFPERRDQVETKGAPPATIGGVWSDTRSIGSS